MRKILALAVVIVMTVALCISANALHHTSADQIMAGSDEHDLAAFGGNNKDGTDLGAVTEEFFYAWGWYSTEVEGGIVEFGYRYGDTVILGSEKFIGGDADVIASQCGGVGESVRFKIAIPVLKGEQEVFAVAKLADGSLDDIWRITYTAENGKTLADLTGGSSQPSQPAEKSPDQWLCGADPGADTQPGWWFNPVGQPDDRYVEVKFTAEGYFSGVHGFYYCSNPDGFPDLGLAYAHMTLQLIKDGKVVAEKEMTPVGDNWYDVDFGKSFEPGEYSLKYSCRDGSGVENNCWCVIGFCGGSGSTTVEANVNAPAAGSYPALMLIGSAPEGSNPGSGDAAIIAIAAVGCIALAGAVVAKKVK